MSDDLRGYCALQTHGALMQQSARASMGVSSDEAMVPTRRTVGKSAASRKS